MSQHSGVSLKTNVCSYLVLVFFVTFFFTLNMSVENVKSERRKEGSYKKPEFPTKWEIPTKTAWDPTPEENPVPRSAKRAVCRGGRFCALPCTSGFYLNSSIIMILDGHFLGL